MESFFYVCYKAARTQLLYYLHILVEFASVSCLLKTCCGKELRTTRDSANLLSSTKQELEKTYCLSSTTPDTSYPGLAQSFGSLPMPRLKEETFQRNREQTPKNRLPTAYYSSGAADPALLLSLCKDGTGPCKSPTAYKGFVRRQLWKPFISSSMLWSREKLERFSKRQLLSQIHLVFNKAKTG